MAASKEQAQAWQTAFGGRLRELREAAGLSQMRLAEAANLHATYISSLERGRRNVSLVNIHVLAGALGVEPAHLLI
ncbi:MAG: helix-turn-helix transcriptional regulator [Mycobacteriales bacterium]